MEIISVNVWVLSVVIHVHLWVSLMLSCIGLRIKKTGKIHLPLENMVEFNGQKVYQEDIVMMGVELATKMTYRDAVKGG